MAKGDKTAREAAEEILRDAAPGTTIGLQTQGEIEHPHGADNHVDSWEATKQADGSVSMTKDHTS